MESNDTVKKVESDSKKSTIYVDGEELEVVDYDDMDDPYVGPMLRNENVMKSVRMYREFELLDIEGALPIIVDLQELEKNRDDFDFYCLFYFVRVFLNKHTLEIYDRPADPRISGYFHIKNESHIPPFFRDAAVHAFDWYHKNHPEGKTKQLKKVDRMSCSPDCYPFYHMTFTVVDEITHQEVTLQAQVIEYAVGGDFQLGMLRDASHDRVLATMRFKEAPKGDNYDLFELILGQLRDKVMVEDISSR